MRSGAPFLQFALKFRTFLDEHGFMEGESYRLDLFHDDLRLQMGKKACALKTVYAAFYGTRTLPMEVVLFMKERFGWKVKWRDTLPVENLQGVPMKTAQMSLPGLRELKR